MNTQIFNWIHGWAVQYKFLDFLGIFFANYLSYILIVAFVALVFLEKNWRNRLYQLFFGLLSVMLARGVMVEVIRFFYDSPRPYIALVFKPLIDLEVTNSFPSGHAAAFFALTTATLLFNHKWGYYFFAGAILMGWARVFVGAHWPTDILGGMAVGALSAFMVWKFLPKII